MATTYATSAPLLGALRTTGSTFYTVSSALNDVDKTQMNSNIMMAPSKFVCLNLPRWQNTNEKSQSFFIDPLLIGQPLQTDPNIITPKLIQNYIENAIAISGKERTDDTFQTIAESMFWKLMMKSGAMKLKESGTILQNGEELPVFVEDLEAYDKTYEPLVVYASEINVLNHITKEGQSYTEVFMHIPTQAHLMQNITFTEPSFKFENQYISGPEDSDYTIGLEDHPLDNTKAIYDTDDKKYMFDKGNKHGIFFDDIFTDVEDKLNADADDFKFNVVLVYYDIWNKEEPATRKTNLYGILFVDKFQNSGEATGMIEQLTKYHPNAVTTGNGYAIRLNIKTSSNQYQTTSETTINDYNSASMELYMTALQRLNEVTDKYEDALNKLYTMKTMVDELHLMIPRLNEVTNLFNRVSTLEKLHSSEGQSNSYISNEQLFELFRTTVASMQGTNKNVNIQLIAGRYFYKDNKTCVLDTNNVTWYYDEEEDNWKKLNS